MQGRREMPDSAPLITAEELEHFPRDDHRYELVDGRLIRMSPVGFQHGQVVMRLGSLLHLHLRERRLGVVVTEVGFKLASNPDTVRGPDLAVIRSDRLPHPDTRGFLSGPPNLVIEVLSPDDRPGEFSQKIAEYLSHDVRMVVVIDPDEKLVQVFAPGRPPASLRQDDEWLDLGEVVPGFRCRLRELFE